MNFIERFREKQDVFAHYLSVPAMGEGLRVKDVAYFSAQQLVGEC